MKMSAKTRTSVEILAPYLPSFSGLMLIFAAYTAAVFTSDSSGVATKFPANNLTPTNQSQSFKVAKKLSAEKLSTLTVLPTRDVASPLETE